MPIIFGTTASGGDKYFTPQPPTIGTATDVGTSRAYNNGAATVTFTPSTSGGTATSFTATSTPGSFTGSASSSPITVSGLQSATSYTFAVTATDSEGTSSASAASNSITATTVPQAPTIGTFTDGGTGTSGTLSFTLNATGGSSITTVKYSTDGTNYTDAGTTSSPITITGLTPGSYTFYVKATNGYGDSAASSGVSGTVITPTSFYNIATATGGSQTITFSSIPSTYKSLQIRMFVRSGAGSNTNFASPTLQFNGDSGSNYSLHTLNTNGSPFAQGNSSATNIPINYASMGDNTSNGQFSATILDVVDYSSTSKNKTIKAFTGTKDVGGNVSDISFSSGLWLNTSAINSITISHPGVGTSFDSGSTFALYGVK